MESLYSIIKGIKKERVMRKIQNKTQKCICTRTQKVKYWLAFVLLFICGIMVGTGFNEHKPIKANVVQWDPTKCYNLQNLMMHSETSAEKLVELNKMYAEYCTNVKKTVKPEVKKEDTSSKETCELIEEIQLRWLYDENSGNIEEHQANVHVYETLFQHGCDANKAKYRDAIAREMMIIESLGGGQTMKSTCEQIEASLLDRLPYADNRASADERIDRAKIYANLSERGCPENSVKYVDLAKQELEIARALEDDEFDEYETIEVVETYKRLNMQAAAQEIFETVKKLTNPTIDFILQVEKIITGQ